MTQYQNNRFICYIKHVFDNITWWFLDRGLQAAAPAAGAAGAAAAAAAPIKNVCKYKTRFNRVCLMSILSEMLSSIHMYIYIYICIFLPTDIQAPTATADEPEAEASSEQEEAVTCIVYIHIYIYMTAGHASWFSVTCCFNICLGGPAADELGGNGRGGGGGDGGCGRAAGSISCLSI